MEKLSTCLSPDKMLEIDCTSVYLLFVITSREGLRQAKDGTIIGMYKFLLVTNFGGH